MPKFFNKGSYGYVKPGFRYVVKATPPPPPPPPPAEPPAPDPKDAPIRRRRFTPKAELAAARAAEAARAAAAAAQQDGGDGGGGAAAAARPDGGGAGVGEAADGGGGGPAAEKAPSRGAEGPGAAAPVPAPSPFGQGAFGEGEISPQYEMFDPNFGIRLDLAKVVDSHGAEGYADWTYGTYEEHFPRPFFWPSGAELEAILSACEVAAAMAAAAVAAGVPTFATAATDAELWGHSGGGGGGALLQALSFVEEPPEALDESMAALACETTCNTLLGLFADTAATASKGKRRGRPYGEYHGHAQGQGWPREAEARPAPLPPPAAPEVVEPERPVPEVEVSVADVPVALEGSSVGEAPFVECEQADVSVADTFVAPSSSVGGAAFFECEQADVSVADVSVALDSSGVGEAPFVECEQAGASQADASVADVSAVPGSSAGEVACVEGEQADMSVAEVYGALDGYEGAGAFFQCEQMGLVSPAYLQEHMLFGWEADQNACDCCADTGVELDGSSVSTTTAVPTVDAQGSDSDNSAPGPGQRSSSSSTPSSGPGRPLRRRGSREQEAAPQESASRVPAAAEVRPWEGPIRRRREPPRAEPGCTTAMLRNIPNKYTRDMLVEQLSRQCRGLFDFLYLPIDFKNRCNVGYAFINFRSEELYVRFVELFDRVPVAHCLPGLNSSKVCEVTPARFHGYEGNVTRLRNSAVMTELNNHPEWMPMIFDADGEAKPFPPPSGPLQAPKLHKKGKKGMGYEEKLQPQVRPPRVSAERCHRPRRQRFPYGG